jgi:hypothetical protein
VHIEGIDSRAWYQADAYILSIDGNVYAWIGGALWEEPVIADKSWAKAEEVPSSLRGEPCQYHSTKRIFLQSRRVIDCWSVQPTGEWCPAPLVSYAIDKGQNIWLLTQHHLCHLAIFLGSTLIVPLGFSLGLIVALAKGLHERNRKEREILNL